MESTKHSLQDHHQFLLPSPSTLVEESSYAAATATTTTGLNSHFCWTPNNSNNIWNYGSLDSYANASGVALGNLRNSSRVEQNDILVPSQDLSSFDWLINNNNPSSHELSQSFSKFSEMISSSPTSSTIEEERGGDINDNNVKILLRTLSPGGGQSSNCSSIPEDFYSSSSSSPQMRRSYSSSQIYPTLNVSSFRQLGNSSSSNFDMNLQALDLLNSGGFGKSLQDQLGLISGNGLTNYGFDNYMKQPPIQRQSNSSNIMTSFGGSRAGEAKRSEVVLEQKESQAAAKRSRMESRASCPPFKVRKEKLGDRIAALQQLVAPFGKTDTSSVLMEAIGYIKFLQSQVETLSVPYLKSSRNKTQRAHIQGGPAENEERKRDLKSRGLCLVPLSCLSYMTDSGGAVWPPPHFGGGT